MKTLTQNLWNKIANQIELDLFSEHSGKKLTSKYNKVKRHKYLENCLKSQESTRRHGSLKQKQTSKGEETAKIFKTPK